MAIRGEGTAAWIKALCQYRYPTLLLAAALVCVELHQYQTAISILDLCTKLEPGNVDVYLLLAQSHIALGQCDKAIPRSNTRFLFSLDVRTLKIYCSIAIPAYPIVNTRLSPTNQNQDYQYKR